MRAIVLVADAFGGRGGIGLYNRFLLRALCDYPGMERVTAIPRAMPYPPGDLPKNLDYRTGAVGGKARYVISCLRCVLAPAKVDLILCAHLYLLPIAYVLGVLLRCPVVPVIYGVEAWGPTQRRVVNYFCRKVTTFIAIRRLTGRLFIKWSGLSITNFHYLPNCIEESEFGIAPRNQVLARQYRIDGKVVVMTAGRLDPDPFERNKGFDEILEILPILRQRIPNVRYLIVGDGGDRDRLVRKSEQLGVSDLVVFAGYVPDAQKADHYRLADVFAMPGSNPMFDRYPFRFVFLEALACGVPVVGCRLEDPDEARDPDAQMIIQVDPSNKNEIVEAIVSALSRGITRKAQLVHFAYPGFVRRLHDIVSYILKEGSERVRARA